ncbi:MAG: SpoIIE family protein phosphatase [Bacteroidales bacterium]|nr:SpoIIE family protein phosphatase [Bacteroidales bacterium]
MFLKRHIIYLTALFCFLNATSQIIPFQNYTVKNGLPSNIINDIEQDYLGYIWLATQVGAVKFDGYNFETFTINEGLPDNYILDIYIDSKNRIWFATASGGLATMKNNKIKVLNESDGLVSNNSMKVFEDKKENIWFVSYEGFSIIMPDTILSYNETNSPIVSEILCTYNAFNGTIWLTTVEGIYYFDDKLHIYDQPDLKNLIIRDIAEDKPGSFWFATQEKGVLHIENNRLIQQFNRSTGLKSDISIAIRPIDNNKLLISTSYPGGLFVIENDKIQTLWTQDIKDFIIRQILVDKSNRIWLRTHENGLVFIKNNELLKINKNNNLVDNKPTKLFEDNNGNIWITSWNGLSKYGKIVFHIYNEGFVDKDKNIQSIASYENTIYAGTFSGLSILENNRIVKRYNKTNGITSDITSIHSILIQSKKEIWLGTFGGLTKFNGNSFVYYPESVFENEDFPDCSWDIEAIKNDLYCASGRGLIHYNKKEYKLYNMTDGLAGDNIWNIEIDSNQNIWCATVNGLSVFDGKLFHNYDTSDGLTINYCHDIAFDKKGYAWLATDKGISRIRLNTDWSIDSRNILKEDGLYSENIFLITVDKKGYIWAGHNNGLDRIDPNDFSMNHYGPMEGFLPVENSLGAVTQTKDGNIWFGTADGVVKYIPKNDIIRNDPPQTYITGVNLYNDTTSLLRFASGKDSIHQLPIDLELKYNKNNLIFSYVGLHYTIVEKNRYRYKLEGYDNYWSEPTAETQTSPYRKIPPGKYTFQVIASNCDGVWNKEPTTFSFEIRPPFYQTWWFYAIEAIFGISLFILIIRYRERKLRHDREVLAQKVKERTIEVEKQRDQIALQKKEITDSIVYAEKIQTAVLPNNEYIDKLLKDYFILFKPRDIVSGDFYWIDGYRNKTIVVAADCTGHGVPGAFMSMLGISILNEVADPANNYEAGQILDTLRNHLTTTLWQTGKEEDAKDGMDLSLCIIDFQNKRLQFAGAYNPLVLIRQNEIIVYKGDKMPVGYHQAKISEFTTHKINLIKSDCLYMFSDGYADQFGGADGKKFKSSNFRELLLEINNLSMSEQKVKLNETIEDWKGINEQVDDILVIGIRIR